jgi:hypothetical protein
MNKMIKKIIYLMILTVALIGFAGQTKAQVLPTVQFEQTPLFSNVNFAPGDSVSRWVKLNNNTTASHRVVLRAINAVSTGDLKNVVGLVIKQGETVLYDNTFANLFSLSELILPQVAAGEQATFDFIATFKTTAGDEYQNSSMGFNLQIGFEDTEEVTDDTTSIGGSSGGSSGSVIIGPKVLIISDDTISSTEPAQPDRAVISWNTNLPSTSQVIYGLASGGPYILNLTLPYFGYPLGTIEDTTKVVSHAVTLYDMVPGQAYSLRVVSKASPPTISYEHTFMLIEDGTIIINPVLALATQNNQNDFLPGGIVNNQNGGEVIADENISATTSDENGLPLSAAVGTAGGFFGLSWWWAVVIVIVGGVLYFIYKKKV